MRIVSFEHANRPHFGVRKGDAVQIYENAQTLSDVLSGGTALGESIPLSAVRLLPPVPRPGKIICIGLNFRDHAKEGGNPIPDYPAVFMRGSTSLVAHSGALVRPSVSDKLDFEAELAVVIGRPAKRVAADRALDFVAGYACFNDGSIRDYQRKSTQWTMGKNFDGTGAFGPELVTPDEVPPGAHGLRIMSLVNGVVMQNGNTSEMIFDVATLIAILSEAMTLEPGDVIATGTPAGVGYARKPPVFLKDGDVCEVRIDGIGSLSNPVINAAEESAG